MTLDSVSNLAPLELTRRWVERVVVGLDLCPFAARPLLQERVRFAQSGASDFEGILQAMLDEVAWIESGDGPETTLLVIPDGVADFDRFLDLVAAAEDLLDATGKSAEIQLAHFHPDYCFEDVPADDPGNLTNRSPLPVLHLLRRRDVAQAIEAHPAPEQIPVQNVDRLRRLGLQGVKAVLEDIDAPSGDFSSPSSD